MLRRSLLAVLFLIGVSQSIQASVGQIVTVDELTCQQAVSYVARYERYYKRTVDGAIPMYPITPVGKNQQVNLKEVLSFHVVRTRDQARCLVGYSARNAN